MMRNEQSTLGLIVPCYNEEAVLPYLHQELKKFSEKLATPLYVLFVNDGSTDNTTHWLDQMCENDPSLACIHFSRNFGHQTAVSAGLLMIRGDVIAVLDADLQDPPDIILNMIQKWKEGYDVVYGIRKNRKEGFFLRTAYSLFYRALRRMANVDIPLDAGDFSLMDRRVVDLLNKMPERNRFVRGLRGWLGFKQIGIPYERQSRHAGDPKYTLKKLYRLALDGVIGFSSIPLRLASWIGAFSAWFGFCYLVYALVQKLVYQQTPSGWTSLVVLLLFFGGIQLLVLGIIGEYIGRIFDEVKCRPHFVVSAKAGWVANHPHLTS